MKHLTIILMFLIGTSCLAADTVWVETRDTTHTEWLPLADSVLVGDANGSGNIDMDDVIFLLEFIFQDGQSPMIYHTVDVYFDYTDSTQVVMDSCIPVATYEHNCHGTRFGKVSQQPWPEDSTE
jgi:hypothetical protein